jgi:hypothetical protein
MSTTIREDSLSRSVDEHGEIQSTRGAAEAQADIQSAIIIARRFPRNEEKVYAGLLKACTRTSFADDAIYSFPRYDSEQKKKVEISGPSVKLAREAARLWGNIRHGFTVIADSEDTRTIEGFAYDLETNTRVAQQTTFTKIVYRREGGWQPANERDTREMTSRHGAFLIRNSILQLIPSDFIDDALAIAEKTLNEKIEKDPDEQKKAIIASFSSLSVPIDELEAYLGHNLSTASPAELRQLRTIYKSIFDGNSTWNEYVSKPEKVKEPDNDKEKKKRAPASSTNERPVNTEAKKSETKPILDESKLSLVRQMIVRKGWDALADERSDVTLFDALLKRRFKIDSMNEITEEMLPDLFNALVAGTASLSEAPVEKKEPSKAPEKEAPKSSEKLTDAEKGKIHQIARAKKWEKGSGSADDPLHMFLLSSYEIDSVTKIKRADFDVIKATLEAGPEKSGFKPL